VGRRSCSSHQRSPSHSTKICARLISEYTSASIAFSQNPSEKAIISAPTTAPRWAIQDSVFERPEPSARRIILSPVRYVNMTARAAGIAESAFTRSATVRQGISVAMRPSRT
jgi:hypothetical protein